MKTKIDSFWPTSRQHWRDWLAEHHDKRQSVWLIYAKKKSGLLGISYQEAVEEALCFGWIDSRAKPIDDTTYRQFFSPRKSASGWSKVNKERIERLIDAGLMMSAGIASIERAKQNGSWRMLDDIEAGIVPVDLAEALQKRPDAHRYFYDLCRSDKRAILQWLVQAKRTETRQNRLTEVVYMAAQRQKPTSLQWAKKRPS